MLRPLRLLGLMTLGSVAFAAGPSRASDPRLADAIAALRHEPVTEATRAHARAELVALIAESPDSEAGICAAYLLGRLRQLGGEAEEPAEFLTLIARHPEHPLAQLARLKLILRRLYALDGPPPASRLADAETFGAGITQPALRGDFHLAMGEAYLFFGDQRAAALRHLDAAEHLGIAASTTRATVRVQVGELARLTGDRARAAASYRAFLDEFPRDIRRQIVLDRLAEVTGGQP